MKDAVIPPREKLEQRGIEGLTEVDLIAVVLGTGVDGCGVMRVARSVLRKLENFEGVEEAGENRVTWKHLEKVKGMGKVKAMQIECAIELGLRMLGKVESSKTTVHCRQDVERMFQSMRRVKQERVVVLALNARNELLGKKVVAVGSLNKAIVEPRDVFSWALEKNASGVILVHNHPSGDVSPSKADIAFTERVREGGELLGIELLDHVIV